MTANNKWKPVDWKRVASKLIAVMNDTSKNRENVCSAQPGKCDCPWNKAAVAYTRALARSRASKRAKKEKKS